MMCSHSLILQPIPLSYTAQLLYENIKNTVMSNVFACSFIMMNMGTAVYFKSVMHHPVLL